MQIPFFTPTSDSQRGTQQEQMYDHHLHPTGQTSGSVTQYSSGALPVPSHLSLLDSFTSGHISSVAACQQESTPSEGSFTMHQPHGAGVQHWNYNSIYQYQYQNAQHASALNGMSDQESTSNSHSISQPFATPYNPVQPQLGGSKQQSLQPNSIKTNPGSTWQSTVINMDGRSHSTSAESEGLLQERMIPGCSSILSAVCTTSEVKGLYSYSQAGPQHHYQPQQPHLMQHQLPLYPDDQCQPSTANDTGTSSRVHPYKRPCTTVSPVNPQHPGTTNVLTNSSLPSNAENSAPTSSLNKQPSCNRKKEYQGVIPPVLIELAKEKELLTDILQITLRKAVSSNDGRIVRIILQHQDLVELYGRKSYTQRNSLLYTAVRNGKDSAVQALLESPLKNVLNAGCLNSALSIAVNARKQNICYCDNNKEKEEKLLTIIRILVTAGADVNWRSRHNRPLAQLAVKAMDWEVLQYLIEAGLDLYNQGKPYLFWQPWTHLISTLVKDNYWSLRKLNKESLVQTMTLLCKNMKIHTAQLKEIVEQCCLRDSRLKDVVMVPIMHGACVRQKPCCGNHGEKVLRSMFSREWESIDTRLCMLLYQLGDDPPGEILLEEYQQYKQYKEACEALQAVVDAPLTLQDCCRICIRDCVRENCSDFANAILALPLPGMMLEYLLGK